MLTLHRYTGQRDLMLGTDFANRQWPETDRMIGFFVNPLPIRIQVNADDSLASFAKRLRHTFIETESRQDMPFNRLVELDSSLRDRDLPLIQSIFVQQNADMHQVESGEVTWTLNRQPPPCKFETAIFVTESQTRLRLIATWAKDLFGPETMTHVIDHLRQTIEHLIDHPDSLVSDLSSLKPPRSERKKVPTLARRRR